MHLDEPSWWYGVEADTDPRVRLLRPLGHAYGWIAERRLLRTIPYRSSRQVICVGNFTAGGTGKTPMSLLVAAEARARGLEPAFLTRGYGGSARSPFMVSRGRTTSAEAGDEPLILARTAPTAVAADRAAGARLIEQQCPGTDVIIMDDGLQNGALAKDLAIAVVDGERGIGNGETIPAGPLRAPLGFQLDLVDAIVVNVPPEAETPNAIAEKLRRVFQGPVLEAHVSPSSDCGWLGGGPVVAFAGIGHPARFFRTLAAAGARIAAEKAFADHHVFSESEAEHLLGLARFHDAMLVTTEKDMARLDGGGPRCRALAAAARTLPIILRLDERDALRLGALLDGLVRGEKRGQAAT